MLINWLSTGFALVAAGVALVACAYTVAAARDVAAELRWLQKWANKLREADDLAVRLESLERGQDRFTDSLARLNGRIGALKSDLLRRGENQDLVNEVNDKLVEENELEAERQALYRKLAERTNGR